MPSHTTPAAARSARRCGAGGPFPRRTGAQGLVPRCAVPPARIARRTSAVPTPAAAPPYWEKHGRTNSAQCLPPLRSRRWLFWCSPFPGTTPPPPVIPSAASPDRLTVFLLASQHLLYNFSCDCAFIITRPSLWCKQKLIVILFSE